MDVVEMAARVKAASLQLQGVSSQIKAGALLSIAEAINRNRKIIKEANAEDIICSEKEEIAAPLLKRLRFDDRKIDAVLDGIKSLAGFDDPVGRTLLATHLDEGLELYKVTCPIGVIGIIFESRPDALVQISALCLKSGNGVLLKGGAEAALTNRVLAGIIVSASEEAGIPHGWLQLLETRGDVAEMLKLDAYIDLIIPRGSNEFVKYIMNNSNIPVLGHAAGICHCFVDKSADIAMAVSITVDSKTQYVAVCNALETLLVHRDIAARFMPAVKSALDEKGVELVGCPETQALIGVKPAAEEDWGTEYLDYKLSIRVVSDVGEAIDHINKYGSHHTDAIVTADPENAARFLEYVDSADVFVNASTRFSDGYVFGLGAEVGISTSKIHARGPVGLEGLVIYKYKLLGNGHIIDDYAKKKKTFEHKPLKKEFSL